MFIYTHPQYPRRWSERIFKYLYVITFLVNFSAFLITVNEFSMRMDTTYKSFWQSDLDISTSLNTLLDNCTITEQDIQISGVTATATIDTSTMEYFFLGMTALCIGIFILHALFICTDFCTKVLYTFNIRNFRIRGLIIRFTWIQPFWLLLYSVFAWSLIGASSSSRAFLQNYVDFCANKFKTNSLESYVEEEIDTDVVFGIDFTFITVAIAINMGIYFGAMVHLVFYGCKARNKRLAKYENPWERGCLGLPHKPMVTAWTGAREALGDALMKDKIDEDEHDLELLENAYTFPSKYLSYFAKMDGNEVINVVPRDDDLPPESNPMLLGGMMDGVDEEIYAVDDNGNPMYYDEQGNRIMYDNNGVPYYPDEMDGGMAPHNDDDGVGDDGGRRRRKKKKHSRRHTDGDGVDAGATTGDDGLEGVMEENGERRHRRKSRKHRKSDGDGLEVDDEVGVQ